MDDYADDFENSSPDLTEKMDDYIDDPFNVLYTLEREQKFDRPLLEIRDDCRRWVRGAAGPGWWRQRLKPYAVPGIKAWPWTGEGEGGRRTGQHHE